MDHQTRQRIRELIGFLELNRDCTVIDADTRVTDTQHLHDSLRAKYESTPDYYHGRPVPVEDLIREMELACVGMCLISPDPSTIFSADDRYNNHASLLAANRYVYESAGKYPQKFIPAGCIDPFTAMPEHALRLVDICVNEYGFLIIMLRASGASFPAGMEAVWRIMNRIIELSAVPAVPYGADMLISPVERLTELADRYRGHPVIILHMGGGTAGYEESEDYYIHARRLGLKYPDLKFVLSMRRDTHTESDLVTYQLAGEPFSRNLFCASGAPYGRMNWNFGGFRWMLLGLIDADHHTDERIRHNPGLFDEEVMRNYLGGNFARFLINGYRTLLKDYG